MENFESQVSVRSYSLVFFFFLRKYSLVFAQASLELGSIQMHAIHEVILTKL